VTALKHEIVDFGQLVPARFVSEALGGKVIWDAVNQQVNITAGS
jgi:hypothetical protein